MIDEYVIIQLRHSTMQELHRRSEIVMP